ncbi:uncharacterized protein LOC133395136 [Anopheles gambiae]|uniref:uncharacterized protein LOC133395136 n=1 Tax=Anopheles gambiae TaxID=7165 RepID=UPI002AC90651|nr:uncharacterized protein LOC133395136 [Anopheles gambiae]
MCDDYDNGACRDSEITKANVDALIRALEKEKQKNSFLESLLKDGCVSSTKRRNDWIEEPSDNQLFEATPRGCSTFLDSGTQSTNEASMSASMSFATLQIAVCQPKDGKEEVDKTTFDRWRELFEAAMEFAGITSETLKMNAFKMKAGPSLLGILESTSTNDSAKDAKLFPYTNTMDRLDHYFNSHYYVFRQRQKLRTMNQIKGESDYQFVKRVIESGKLCNYKEEQLIETIVDVIQVHAINPKVRMAGWKILKKRGTITDLLEKVRTCEIEKFNENAFARDHRQNETTLEVSAVSHNTNAKMSRTREFQRDYPSYKQKHWGMQENRGFSKGEFSKFSTNRSFGIRRILCRRCSSNTHQPENCYVDDAFDEDNEKHILYSLDAGDMSISWTEIQTASETDEELEASN